MMSLDFLASARNCGRRRFIQNGNVEIDKRRLSELGLSTGHGFQTSRNRVDGEAIDSGYRPGIIRLTPHRTLINISPMIPRNWTTRADRSANGTIPIPLIIGATLFLVVIVYLVAASFLRKAIPMFDPTVGTPFPRADILVVDTITIDASDGDVWRFFDFALGSTMEVPDTAGWDLAFRRFQVVPSAAVAPPNVRPVSWCSMPPTQ